MHFIGLSLNSLEFLRKLSIALETDQRRRQINGNLPLIRTFALTAKTVIIEARTGERIKQVKSK
jgi:uncharacterized membrane protein (GlpM family)